MCDEVARLSVRDLSIKVEYDDSLCVDMGRRFRRDSLLVSKRIYMSKSTEKLQEAYAAQHADAGREASPPSAKRRVRFAEKAKVRIISRVDELNPLIGDKYWYTLDDRARSERCVVEETKLFRKLHKIRKSRRRQSLQEGSKPSSTQLQEEELIWSVIDANSCCVRGLEHFIDRRMKLMMKEEQKSVIEAVLFAQNERRHSSDTIASVSASLTKDARLRASLLGMEDQETVQAIRWDEEQKKVEQKKVTQTSSSLRPLAA